MCARVCDGTQREKNNLQVFWVMMRMTIFGVRVCVFFCVCVLRQYGFLRTIAVKRNIEFGAFFARLGNTYPVCGQS